MSRLRVVLLALGLSSCIGDPFLPAGAGAAADAVEAASTDDADAAKADAPAAASDGVTASDGDAAGGSEVSDVPVASDAIPDTAADADADGPSCPEAPPLVVTVSDGADGPGTARFDEAITVTVAEADGLALEWTAEPPSMAGFVSETADPASLALQVTDVPTSFGTTTVSISFSAATTPGCPPRTGAAEVRVTGNVWATQWSPFTVVAYRSDGSYVGQALPAAGDDSPDAVFQLDADHVATGGFWADTVRVFDRHTGALVTSFVETLPGPDAKHVYDGDGPRAVMRHSAQGRIWVGGPTAALLVFEPTGDYVEQFDYATALMQYANVQSMVQLPGGDTIVVGSHWTNNHDWFDRRIGVDGEDLGPFASGELSFRAHHVCLDWQGDVMLSGRERFSGDFVMVRVSPTGLVKDVSEPTDAIEIKDGLAPFGRGFLVGTNAGTLGLVNEDLELVDPAYISPQAGDKKLKGFIVLDGP